MTRTAQTTIIASLAMVAATLAFAPAPSSAASALYTNPTPITVPEKGEASPYPSSINVQGLPGRITRVVVGLRQFSHTRIGDVDVLLVSPDGESSVLMSDTCGETASFSGRTWFFDQGAASEMLFPCDQLVYRPINGSLGSIDDDAWPGTSPGSHTANLDHFIGDDPNGTWRLHVVDDFTSAGTDSGKINLGWTLAIETEVPDALVPGPGQGGLATPYPITRTISGVDGVISDIDVSLSGVYHERPDDLDLLLAGPRGQKVMLMSDACGATAAKDADWGWNDEAAGPMADNASCPTGFSYRPTDHEPGDDLPGPAPAGPYASSMSAFDFSDPNGEWRLYAYDDTPGDAGGFFVERFALHIETRPRAATGFTETAVGLTEGETRDLTIRRDSDGPGLGEGTVSVTSMPLSATSGADYDPISRTVELARGQQDATVPVAALADLLPEGEETFAVTISQPSGDVAVRNASTALVTIREPDPGPGGDPGPLGDPLPGDAAGGSGGDPGADRDAPAIGRVTLTPARFAIARRATARTAARGTTIRYTLSEPAVVTLRFQRAAAGRRVGRSCRPVTTRNRRGRPCRRYVAAGTLRRSGRPGANRVAFSGRIGRRALRRGAHRLVVTAVDPAGNRSTSRPRRFRIVR